MKEETRFAKMQEDKQEVVGILMKAWSDDNSTLKDMMCCFHPEAVVDAGLKEMEDYGVTLSVEDKKKVFAHMMLDYKLMLYRALRMEGALEGNIIYNLKWGNLDCHNNEDDLGVRGDKLYKFDVKEGWVLCGNMKEGK